MCRTTARLSAARRQTLSLASCASAIFSGGQLNASGYSTTGRIAECRKLVQSLLFLQNQWINIFGAKRRVSRKRSRTDELITTSSSSKPASCSVEITASISSVFSSIKGYSPPWRQMPEVFGEARHPQVFLRKTFQTVSFVYPQRRQRRPSHVGNGSSAVKGVVDQRHHGSRQERRPLSF